MMFWKPLIALILTVAAAVVSKSTTVTIAVFLLAMIVVFVFEGVRIVPQQSVGGRRLAVSRVIEPGCS